MYIYIYIFFFFFFKKMPTFIMLYEEKNTQFSLSLQIFLFFSEGLSM